MRKKFGIIRNLQAQPVPLRNIPALFLTQQSNITHRDRHNRAAVFYFTTHQSNKYLLVITLVQLLIGSNFFITVEFYVEFEQLYYFHHQEI